MGLLQFIAKYPDESACIKALFDLKWSSGFACSKCASTKAHHLASRPRIYECAQCGHQNSVTAGTVLHKTRTDLTKWFACAHLMASDKRGASALYLSRQLGIRYATVWLMCHKLRDALFERDEFRLSGFVECDEAFYGGYREKGSRGRGMTPNKSMMVIAVEKRLNAKGRWVAGGARLEVVTAANAETLVDFMQRNIRPSTEIVTDGWTGYVKLPAAGYVHSPRPGNGAMAEKTLPLVHIMISNLKAWLNGTFHGVSKKHLGRYLREWAYRFNRRGRVDGLSGFFLRRAANQATITYAALVA